MVLLDRRVVGELGLCAPRLHEAFFLLDFTVTGCRFLLIREKDLFAGLDFALGPGDPLVGVRKRPDLRVER